MMSNIEVVAINSDNVFDRLKLCWGHLDDWRHLEIVLKSKEWLEKANAFFKPTTFIAYKGREPIGMIEFVPLKLLKNLGLCPCRVNTENKETEDRYIISEEFENYLFIPCLFVSKDHQGKGVGKTLLNHILYGEVFKNFDGVLVYVTERDERWDKYVHWPAGPKEFYLKAGFVMEKTLRDPIGYLLCYRKVG